MLLELISKNTLIEKDQVLDIANKASTLYARFTIPKKDGSERLIYQPSMAIRALQKVVYDGVLDKLPVHDACYAYRKGRGLKEHANIHRNSKYLLRIDLKDFFESITRSDIEKYCNEYVSKVFPIFNEGDFNLMIDIICRKNTITIGSVTSPSLSNSICYNLDEKISRLSDSYGVKYTRYADDMFFSTTNKNILKIIQKEVSSIIKKLDYPKLTINNKKTRHSSKKNRMSVTGVVITVDKKLSIGRDKKRFIRGQVYNWKNLSIEEKSYLSGYLSFVKSVEPSYINRLCDKYSSHVIQEILRFS
ncbi:retron St85 family RNA-directed DNA polymerase [Vibrio caribbeanicus]|uniref:RNA-directed DNA polymerase n=1 Tax=Vibrio caribbeanicus ATCC BAA-2122 TaxID=796620 RepID=E3BPY5_9VIBR|nr:retron St85 family RNA-directed DNA polymerase [Vibrio caribbeanicus]EFP94910.1 putative reverse transcriptase [Vibrio caribbeanicus ATCC BAA-2122]